MEPFTPLYKFIVKGTKRTINLRFRQFFEKMYLDSLFTQKF